MNSARSANMTLRSRAQTACQLTLRDSEIEALTFLLPLSPDYPGIESWFRTKVVPGLRDESRVLFRVERHGQLVGIAIAKRYPEERKICTVRVAPQYFGRGIGVRLFDKALRWLDDDRPHLTVSEGKLPAFQRIFDFYGFDLTSIQSGLYKPNASEFSYNECSRPDLDRALTINSSKFPY
ncbi:GNAT family N-acetyltransferase [Bradyrhizobium sp. Pa8]|uniref:GNAT family N-acetyltransferase n=1 Tax=Bradyrhizobium sp. Pa8 TaxID=3386552 RepID=UPI00403F8B4D